MASQSRRGARSPVAAAAALVVAVVAMLPSAMPASALQITTFSDGSLSRTLDFGPGGGTDASSFVSVPKSSFETSAGLTVAGGPDGGSEWPWDVGVFARTVSNSTQIYGFSGPAYGAMGRQTLFSGGGSSGGSFGWGSGAGSVTSTGLVYLPKGATLASSTLTITGSYFDEGFVGPDYLNRVNGANQAQITTEGRGSPYLVDIDGDGDLDLFAGGGNFSGFNAGGPRFFRNTGNDTVYRFEEQPGVLRTVQKNYGAAPALADLDNDGDFDLITTGSYCPGTYNVRFWWNNGTSTVPSWQANNTTFSGVTTDCRAHPAFADLDGDGDFDLIIGDESGALTYLRNTGSKTAPAWTSNNLFSGINVGANSAPTFADYDGDGDLDMVVGNGTLTTFQDLGGPTTFTYYRNDGNATSPSFVKTDLLSTMHVGGSYTDTNVAPFMADLDNDGDMDLVVADASGDYWLYNGRRSAPSGVQVDIGADGVWDWSSPDVTLGSLQLTGLTSALSGALTASSSVNTDAWGNRMALIRVALTSATAGYVDLSAIDIQYAYTAPALDFSALLNRVRDATAADASGNVPMAIPVTASSAGNVTLGGLAITADLPPTATNPGVQTLLEDTRVDNLLDLAGVFSDDFTPSNQLVFNVTGNSAAGVVDAFISGGHYLGVDASTGSANDNWFGFLNVTVTGRDIRGLSASITIIVYVSPVNDLPVIGGLSSTYSVLEDTPWSVTPTGTDVDGDPLTWTIIGQPAGSFFDPATGALSWTPRNPDVGNHSITLYLSDGAANPVQFSFSVLVINVNDAPFLLPIANQTVFEGQALALDLTGYYGDEDDPPYTLVLTANSPHTTLGGSVLTILFPKNSGVNAERVNVTVTDPHGASASRVFVITVIPASPDIVIVGVPDMQVVETVLKTIDLTPYLYNVKNWANVSISTTSAQATVSGVKVTFLYPKGYPSDTEHVTLIASEGDASSKWVIAVTVVRLGSALLIADLPDLDVAADEEMVLELSPYIHNVVDGSALTFSASSPYATFQGTTLHLLYPRSAGVSVETVTITVTEGAKSSADSMSVRVRSIGGAFYLDPIPPITVVEGQPFVLFMSSYIHNAKTPTSTVLSLASAFASAEGLQVTFLYPVNGGLQGEQVQLVARDGSQVFSTVISVTVVSIGGTFTLAGLPNVEVFEGSTYNLTLIPYLYNVGAGTVGTVVVSTSSSFANVTPGPTLKFLYPKGTNLTHESVKITAIYQGVASNQTISVTIRALGSRLTIAPIPEIHVVEDEPYEFDLLPYIFNAKSPVRDVLTDSAFATVHDGSMIRLLYPGGFTVDEFFVTVQSGTEFAQRSVRVFILDRNDAPRLTAAPANWTGVPGATVVWDLTDYFTDEENPDGLTFAVSDTRVVIDNTAKTASFEIPAEGVFHFTFTAVDGDNSSLTTVSPDVAVTGRAGATHAGRATAAGAGDDFSFGILFLLLGAGLMLLSRRDGGRSYGASSSEPTMARLVGRSSDVPPPPRP